MTCQEVREELLASWGSTETLAVEVVEHLGSCEECHLEGALLRKTRVLLETLPAEYAPPRLTERVLAEIARHPAANRRNPIAAWFAPQGQPAWARAAAVGVALALAVAGGTIYSGRQDPGTNGILPMAPINSVGALGPQLASGQSELDELMLRHQTLEQIHPLSEDPGVSLVAYTTTY